MPSKSVLQITRGHALRLHSKRRRMAWLFCLCVCLTFSILASTLASPPVFAAEPSFDEEREFGSAASSDVAVGDLDSDGDLDIVTISWILNDGAPNPGFFSVYINDGDGNYDLAPNNASPHGSSLSVALGDMNGDGHLDIVIGNGQTDRDPYGFVYLNDGNGDFGGDGNERKFGAGISSIESVAIGDMNGDGSLDIVTGTAGQSTVYLNDGEGDFDADGNTRSFGGADDNTRGFTVGDMDGDGSLDIIAGNNGQSAVYLNDGEGNFDADSNVRTFGAADDDIRYVAVGDMDGDGWLDIASDVYGRQNMVYLNNGNGVFDWNGSERIFGNVADFGHGLTAGDMDGDGDVDIVAQNTVHLNTGDGDFTITRPFGPGDYVGDVAIGDTDNDGDLDIISESVVYVNDGNGILGMRTYREAMASNNMTALAVGDMDMDGDADLITNGIALLNDGKGNFSEHWMFGSDTNTAPKALADMDGDGYLDIVTSTKLFLNDGTGNIDVGLSYSGEVAIHHVAVGDVDGDGSLDAVSIGPYQTPIVFLNDGVGNLILDTLPPEQPPYTLQSVALGDLDRDGALDVVAGVSQLLPGLGASVEIFMNDGSGKFVSAGLIGGNGYGDDVAVGDMNGDGKLDIISSELGRNWVRLQGDENDFDAAIEFGQGNRVVNMSVTDMDGDGDLDVIVGVDGYYADSRNMVYLNDGAGNLTTRRDFGVESDNEHFIAVGDMDGDGDADISVANHGHNQIAIYANDIRTATGLANHSPEVQAAQPFGVIGPNSARIPEILDDRYIDIPYSLFDPEGDPVGHVRAFYSMDGGGRWLPAVATTDTITTHLRSAFFAVGPPAAREDGTNDALIKFDNDHQVWLPLVANDRGRARPQSPAEHSYRWDTFLSGFFGQSDNVALRLVAYPQMPAGAATETGAFTYVDSVSGLFQWPYSSGATLPFRVRGTQVRVVDEEGVPVPNALVYRLPVASDRGAALMPDPDQPLDTDQNGYLQGRGQLDVGDRLVAAVISSTHPITFTMDITSLQTSAMPTVSSLDYFTVTQSGVQTLTIPSAESPNLLLANLDVALEWDARNDLQFVEQLRFDLERASQLLYDWTDGQMALGRIRVYHDAPRIIEVGGFQPWVDGHIRVYATNSLRPSAAQGGIVATEVSLIETVTVTGNDGVEQSKTIDYGAGQVYMGAIWNRYGEANGSLGEDWPRALAHELGHYLLFLEDNYLSFNDQKILVTVPANECPGAMNDPYRDAYSEFQPEGGWSEPGCVRTLSQQELGRTDWETIRARYPNLAAPQRFNENPGPSAMPLDVTQISFVTADDSPTTLDVPLFYLIDDAGAIYIPDQNARAFLFQGNRLTDLGQPALDQVQAWGARAKHNDRICVFEGGSDSLGCEVVRTGDDQVTMGSTPGEDRWEPDIRVTPVSSRTIAVEVLNVDAGVRIGARLYPVDDVAGVCILLAEESDRYVGLFPTAREPILDGHIHVWQDSGNGDDCSQPTQAAQRESITSYNIGGNPVHRRSRGVHRRSRGVHRRSRGAPAMSSDGQVILFGEVLETNLDEEWFVTLQETNRVPALPPGRTLVGQGYRLNASPNAPELTTEQGASISFGYLGDQVPADEEAFLRVYYYAEDDEMCHLDPAACWRQLDTALETDYNLASARAQGSGLYALMSSREIVLQPGWNNIAYPVQSSQPVSTALASIADFYTVVYHYEAGAIDPEELWSVHGSPQTVPEWVSDLRQLDFGQGYMVHISATQPVALYLGGIEAALEIRTSATEFPVPATYYAESALALSSIKAYVDGNFCGAGVRVVSEESPFRYRIKVQNDDGADFDGCGASGRTVSFSVNDEPGVVLSLWDNTQVQALTLPNGAVAGSSLPGSGGED